MSALFAMMTQNVALIVQGAGVEGRKRTAAGADAPSGRDVGGSGCGWVILGC